MPLTRRFTLVIGLIYLIAGVGGFFSSGFDTATHQLFVFDVNWVMNVVYIVIGLLWLFAFQAGPFTSRLFDQVLGVIFVIIGLLGFLHQPLAGLFPLGGADIWAHLATGIIALFFGFAPAQLVASERK